LISSAVTVAGVGPERSSVRSKDAKPVTPTSVASSGTSLKWYVNEPTG